MRLNMMVGAMIAATGLVLAGSASAKVYDINVSGTLDQFSDPNGIFGLGSQTAGVTFDETIAVDTSMGIYGTAILYPQYGGTETYISKLYNDASSFPISGSLTINGVTINVDGLAGDNAEYTADNHEGGFGLGYATNGSTTANGKQYQAQLSATSSGGSGGPFGMAADPLLNGYASPFGYGISFTVGGASGSVYQAETTSTVTVLDSTGGPSIIVSAAPEPSVWALMLAGVAMIGLTLRQGRRQRATVLTA